MMDRLTSWQRRAPADGRRAMFCLVLVLAALSAAARLHAQAPSTDGPAAMVPEEVTEVPERSVWDVIRDGGAVGIIIILLSIVALGFAIEHALSLRKEALMPETAAAELQHHLQEQGIDDAITYCESERPSLLTQVVLAGLLRYKDSPFGHLEYRAAIEEAGEEQTARLYRKTEALGLIGAIAPMLGLTGTVLGMIKAFNKIAATGGMARPDQLAGGIGQALVTTLLGLIVAIPSMVAFTYFRNRIDFLVAEAGKRVEQITASLAKQGS